MRTATGTVLIFSLLALGCSAQGPTAPPLDQLAAAPTSVVVASATLELETYLWRDFMPVSPPDGKPLIGVFRISTRDGRPIPDGLTVEAAHVIHEGEVWSTHVKEEQPSEREDVLEVVARQGPKSGPEVSVDVVLRIRHQGHTVLLRAPDQPIHRTS